MDSIKTINTNRSAYWDNMKGVLMLLVVFAHILFQLQDYSDTINSTVDYIYMFHMPAFVFISGFFGKSERSHSFESIIKLVFLFFIFNSIIGFIYGFKSLLQPMFSYWYLIALIAWRLTAHHIAKFKDINLILFIIALFAGFYSSIDNTFSAARIIGFYPFYMSGYLLSAEKSDKLCRKKYTKKLLSGSLCLIGSAVLMYIGYHFFYYTDNALQMAAYEDSVDAFGRIVLYVIAFLAIYALRCFTPQNKIPFITMFGRNSLWIYVFHRPFTLLISDHIKGIGTGYIMMISVISSLAICLIFGNDFICKYFKHFMDGGAAIFTSDRGKKTSFSQIAALMVSLGFIVSALVKSYAGVSKADIIKLIKGEYNGDDEAKNTENDYGEEAIYPIMTDEQEKEFNNAFRITFAGDLILLEDQVKRAYNGSEYDFTDVFEYAQPYISSADYAIGVFEGPMAGEKAGYTSSNFNDGKELYLNFPDSFASDVKKSGFDLVTTANNHLLDKGEEGALRTIDILDKIGLDHTGSYRSAEDKEENRVKLIECQGIKMAVLSYTYGSNHINDNWLIDGRYSYLTSVISDTEGERFEKLRQSVEEDFQKARSMSPDLIVVLPHIGTQFSNEADETQKKWFDIFIENGADIILGDHPHVVEPVQIENNNGKNVFISYCPGNFANIYREDQGDTSMLIDVYIDRDTKKVIGGSIVPLYTHARADGNYRAVPIHEVMFNKELREQLTTDDIDKAAESNALITNVVFRHEMDISSVTERYYFNENGFIRSKAEGLDITEEMKSGALYSAMKKADSICFIGDSVTEGTKNGGCPWYEPIEKYFKDKQIMNYSKGGCTVSYMTERADNIPKAQLYVIALGTNDVRYRDDAVCAMTANDYILEIESLRSKLSTLSPDSDFVFIAPWYSTDGDPFCLLSFAEKTDLNDEYSSALEQYCKEHSYSFINANTYIRDKLTVMPDKTYLLDHIHPNASKGVVMYSEAVLSYQE